MDVLMTPLFILLIHIRITVNMFLFSKNSVLYINIRTNQQLFNFIFTPHTVFTRYVLYNYFTITDTPIISTTRDLSIIYIYCYALNSFIIYLLDYICYVRLFLLRFLCVLFFIILCIFVLSNHLYFYIFITLTELYYLYILLYGSS